MVAVAPPPPIFASARSSISPGYSPSIVSYKHLRKNALHGGNTKDVPSSSLVVVAATMKNQIRVIRLRYAT